MDFPNRPQHPDFMEISHIVCTLDELTKDGLTVEEIHVKFDLTDLKSIEYMAEGRCNLVLKHLEKYLENLTAKERELVNAMIYGAWMEAFTVGELKAKNARNS